MNSKRFLKIVLMVFISASLAIGGDKFTKMASGQPKLTQKGASKMWCPVCGMSLKMFYKTSHTSKHKDTHKDRQYCSIRCLVVDMKEFKIDLKDIKVDDVVSEKLIDANSAFYVVGSKVMGTMTKVSKLAFAKKADAEAFVKKRGGKIVNFATALDLAKKSLKNDIAMTNMKKKKKMYPMGKKIFTKMCNQKIDPTKYNEINELKADIKAKKLCGNLKHPKKFQAVALYLWEVKRFGDRANLDTIKVTKDEKCPVCGMFVYKYPRWAAQIEIKNKHHFSFDGVKDLMKFYFEPAKWGDKFKDIKKDFGKISVTDYYSQKKIDGKKAFFVIGSDILGPMGNELIPFANESDAKSFKSDHRGKKIVKFSEITKESIYQLDK